jgi:hypothetical protein
MDEPPAEEWAVREIHKYTLANPIVYTPLILVLILLISVLITLRKKPIAPGADAPAAAPNPKKLSAKQIKRLEKKEAARLQREANERVRQEFFLNQIINDDAPETSSGMPEAYKREIQQHRERGLKERKARTEMMEVEARRRMQVEGELVDSVMTHRYTALNAETLAMAELLVKRGSLSGIIQETTFVRLDEEDLSKLTHWIEVKGKVSVKAAGEYLTQMLHDEDVDE